MKTEILVLPQSGKAFKVNKGDVITVIDTNGGQVADFYAVNADNPNEFLSTGVTIDCNSSLKLKKGNKIFSNLYCVMFEILDDDVGEHDLLHPCCRPEMYDFFYKNGSGHKNCLDNINESLFEYRLPKHNIIQPINIFMNTVIKPDGSISVEKPLSKQGDKIKFLTEMDIIVGIAACSVEESDCNGGKCTPIKVIIE